MGILDSYAIDNFVIDGTIGGINKVINFYNSFATTSSTVNISAVDMSKSVVLINWRSDLFYAGDMPTAKIISNTQIQLDKGYQSSSYTYVYGQVIEFKKVKSIQRGESYANNVQVHDIYISSVDLTKSIVVCTMRIYSTSTASRYTMFNYYLLKNQQIRVIFADIVDAYVVWQVVEFD